MSNSGITVQAKVRGKVFALPPRAAAALGIKLATLGTPLSQVPPHVVALGFRPDGVTLERVVQAYVAHNEQG